MEDKPTIEDVAEEAGVAASTVSLALNEKPHVSPETRKKVLQAARKLDYRPHTAAQSLATGNSDTISLVVPIELKSVFSSTEFFQKMISGMHRATKETGKSLSLQIVESEEEAVERIREVSQTGSVSGSIVTHPTVEMPYLEPIRKYDFPTVFLGDPVEELPYVDNDNIEVSQLATDHLLEHGYQKVAMLSGPENLTVSRNRLTGYRSALEASDISFEEELVWESELHEQSAYEVVLEEAPKHEFSALYVSVEVQGIGALRALRELDLEVPADVALVVAGDSEMAKHLSPSLTTVDLNTESLGYLSAKKLVRMIEGEEELPQLIVPADLKRRESCGCKSDADTTTGNQTPIKQEDQEPGSVRKLNGLPTENHPKGRFEGSFNRPSDFWKQVRPVLY